MKQQKMLTFIVKGHYEYYVEKSQQGQDRSRYTKQAIEVFQVRGDGDLKLDGYR